jgi:hypothetical protein
MAGHLESNYAGALLPFENTFEIGLPEDPLAMWSIGNLEIDWPSSHSRSERDTVFRCLT